MKYSILNVFKSGKKKISYSQCGEDIIVEFVFDALGIEQPAYVDIGSHDPIDGNNTYLFYRKGSKGVCIEPNLSLCKKIRKRRKRDKCLNMGVGVGNQRKEKYYIMDLDTLSTFSSDEADRIVKEGSAKIIDVIDMGVINVEEVIREYFSICPNYISIDIEGLELDIIKSIDLASCRPEVFCVETLSYSRDRDRLRKRTEILDYMKSRNYVNYADTYINTIFVDRKAWRSGSK